MTRFHRRPVAAAVLAVFSTFAQAQSDQTLPEIRVQGEAERADGPVTGYRATRSSTATKTDTPLREVPASVTVVPSSVMKDQAMQSMGDVFRYVPGVLMHQGEGNRDRSSSAAPARPPTSMSTGCGTTRRYSAISTTWSGSKC